MIGAAGALPAAGAVEPDAWAVAPFDLQLAGELRALIARLSPAQRLWLSGYLAGVADRPVSVGEAAAPAEDGAVLVLFGSQTGNSERLARELRQKLAGRGVEATLLEMSDCTAAHLQNARMLFAVVSTHGDGDPPDRAVGFTEWIHSRKAPRLSHLRFSVLALGDSSYEHFCATGRRLEARLRELGAEVLHERADCDVDFEATAAAWMSAVCEKLPHGPAASRPSAAGAHAALSPVPSVYTRKNPFIAPVLANQKLTGRDSTKDVRHIELSLEGSGIRYEPGDALGVVHENSREVVEALLGVLPFDPEAAIEIDSRTVSLREALTCHREIGVVSRTFVERYAQECGHRELCEAATRDAYIRQIATGGHLIDLVSDYPPVALSAGDFVRLLRPLTPRLYSIASSYRATPTEVHLTVSPVVYDFRGQIRRGAASSFLHGLSDENGTVPVYVHRNPNFRLPADPQSPVIMIGAGTGIAPFRAFLAEREALGINGRTWLFFGERTFLSDFLYQSEWLAWRKRGVLTRIDVAFSRDQPEKVYVQHRIRERGAELWRWMQEGAHVYVCGDAQRMAPDVHAALLDMLHQHGGLDPEQAREHLLDMQRERRYQRDVY